MKKILGISAYYHDSAAAILIDGKIIAAVQEERFTREKNTATFPFGSIAYCLEKSGLKLEELDAVVFYDKPLLKFERIIETHFSFAPKGLIAFLTSMPSWLGEKLFLKNSILKKLSGHFNCDKKKIKLLFTEHHLSHAASSFFASPFKEAAVLTMDGVGEWATTSIGIANGNAITFLKEIHFPHSLGLLYSSFTYFLGFKVNSGEYKLMGLAPYGNPLDEQTKKFVSIIKSDVVTIYDDGSFKLNLKQFSYTTGLRMVNDKHWEKLFGIKKRIPESEINQEHSNLALAIQLVCEEIVVKLSYEAKKITGCENLCLAGGVALNCVANGKIANEKIFKNIFVQPASGDAGGALGAALAAHYIYFGKERENINEDEMQGALLGPEYSNEEIEEVLKRNNCAIEKYDNVDLLCSATADLLKSNNVVGWFQGRMEFGPRSLGNRSILGNPVEPSMQEIINSKIKLREGFRPFAPAVLEEDCNLFFDMNFPSPYMLFTAELNKNIRKELPFDFQKKSNSDKLKTPRSNLQSVTHVDFSARVQTVNKSTNPIFYKLLLEFKKQSGFGVLINTSFNVRGEPIVCSPEDALHCFLKTKMDYLVLGNYILDKKKQIH